MSIAPLRIIPAGAGSGKTHTIQEQLGEWVINDLVAPERIVAVTFTEAAAAELRERIRAKLLALGRLEDAIKLDQAYITTIHGFGLRLLTEFAFDAGLSPKPRLLNEDEENTLISLALAKTEKADLITSSLDRFGYRFDFNSKKSAEEMFRADLLDVVKQLRASGWKVGSEKTNTHSEDWIRHHYGLTPDADDLKDTLYKAVKGLLGAYPESMVASYGTSKAAADDLKRDYRNLKNVVNNGVLDNNWKVWNELRKLRVKVTKAKIPEDYAELGQRVIEAADALPHHPGPRDHAIAHINTLLAAGKDVLELYAEAKREAGLVDFSDMIAMAGELLRTRPDVIATLKERIGCLVVDEFQDTNPLQFSFIWQLKEAGLPTVTVGDLKQAIMGFQGADPRLFDALINNNPDV
ncbi:MAG: UvrD-helicase domain-containing protein, partial [Saprospiraceae bacterium]|nr:UvrD-helicase domain-containing protein [Saprospiraceae bacterium]